ncbi:hypothetical protein KZZ52_32035 [Dactylosporangium sp. AC04546]|uniref:hypothetical protein n=1 Tax=Dactylosporangium sp. AC04546 TaxID=2862460 RepID=UPI001EDE8D34|nr:hypothetical protein [Dactylosporangium sp. AC04546]WVK78621.1 hypothetical protein KZZ52_32035 [Dactylosporangium sp. AC04546]
MPACKRALAVLGVSLLMGALAACGSSDDDGAPGADAGGPSTAADGPGAEFRDRNLLVTAVCSAGANGGWLVSVDGWDPKTWQHESRAEFPVPVSVLATEQQADASPKVRSGLVALCTSDPRGPLSRSTRDGEGDAASVRLARSLFDRNFTKMAVVIRDGSGASHVGYVDRSGTLADLTATDTGFGSTPREQRAVLSPDGADVWFSYRAGGAWKVGSRSTGGGDHSLTQRSTGDVPDLPLFLVGDPVHALIAYNVVVSPDGKRYSGWAPADNNQDDVFAVPAGTAALTDATPKVADNGCAGAVGWLDDSTLLCPVSLDENLAAVAVDGPQRNEQQPILPDTNRSNIGMVISPDGAQVVFLSAAGTEREYWIAATRPGATPRKVERTGALSALSDTAVFVEWC